MRALRSPLTLSSRQTAERFIARREWKMAGRRGNAASADEAVLVRAAILSAIGRLTPKFAPQIAEDASEIFGEDISERRVYRYLRTLIEEGEVQRTPEGYLLAPQRRRV